MKIEEAIEWMEEAVQETTECFEQCSPTLQEELIKQKEVFELALTALRSMPETTKPGWISVKERLPDEEVVVETKIDDGSFIRNIQELKRRGKLWFTPNGSMYVYYIPTHWRPILETTAESVTMEHKELTAQLRRMSVETGSLMCLGCGYEHNCGIHGCALLRQAVETIEKQAAAIERLRGHECSGLAEKLR